MNKIGQFILIFSLSIFLAACSGGGGSSTSSGGSSATPNTATTNTTAVGGTVSKGPVINATVDIYTFNANGTQGSFVVGGITTDAYGAWNANIPSTATGPFMVIATGGSFVDEYTGATVPLGVVPLRGILPAGATSAPITPISDAAVTSIQQMVTDGYASSPATAFSTVQTNYLNSLGFDPLTVIPPAPENIATASADEIKYAAVLGGISTLANDAYSQLSAGGNTPDRMEIIAQMAADFAADGSIDGYGAAGAALNISVGGAAQALNGVFTGGANLGSAVGTYQALATAPAQVTGATVTVTPVDFTTTIYVDTTAPTITVPASITITVASGVTSVLATDTAISTFLNAATATDNIDSSVTVTHNAPASFVLGVTTVTFTATDVATNNSTATATVTINVQAPTPDTTAPVVTAPANITVAANQAAAITAFLNGATATDNIDGTVAVTHNAPLPLSVGAHLITFSATDAASNTGTASATITVIAPPVSTTPFTISFPGYVAGATCDASKLTDPLFSNYFFAPYQWTQFTTDPGAVIEVFFDNPTVGQNKVRIRCANLNHSWNGIIPSSAINKTSSTVSITFNNFAMPFASAGALAPGFITVPGSQLGITLNGTLNPVVQENLTTTLTASGKAWSAPTTNLLAADQLNGPITFDGTTYRIFQPNISGGFKPTAPNPTSTVYSSADGLNWTKGTYNMTSAIGALIWLNGQYTTFAFDYSTRKQKLLTSTDGITWTTQIFAPPSSARISAMTTDGTTIVAVGAQGYIITSTDGITWTQRSRVKFGVTKNDLNHVVWNGTTFVAAGTIGTVVTSPDAINWTAQQSGTNYRITSLATLNGKFFASAASNVVAPVKLIITSSDGTTWSRLFKNPVGNLGTVVNLGNSLIIQYTDSTGSYTLTTADGVTWSRDNAIANIKLINGFTTSSGTFSIGENRNYDYGGIYQRN